MTLTNYFLSIPVTAERGSPLQDPARDYRSYGKRERIQRRTFQNQQTDV